AALTCNQFPQRGGPAMPTMRTSQIFTLATAAVITLASCRQASETHAAAPAPRAQPVSLYEDPQFSKMLQAYREKLGPSHKVLRFELPSSSASLALPDADTPRKAVAYRYQESALTGPSRVDLSDVLADLTLDDNLFDLDQVALERIPALVQA